MFKFYKGHLNLQNSHVKHIASIHGNELTKRWMMEDWTWFDRYVNQTMYWFNDPSRIRNPISILLANGYMHGVHPGASRFMGVCLSGAKSMLALAVCHIDPSIDQTLKKYMLYYEPTDNVKWNIDPPCNHTFLLDEAQEFDEHWWKEDSIEDVNAQQIWNKQPNLEWYDSQNNLIFKKVINENAQPVKINIGDNYQRFWDSLAEIARS